MERIVVFNWRSWLCLFTILSCFCLCVFFGNKVAAEDFELASVPETSESSEMETSTPDSSSDPEVAIVQNATVDDEFQINNDTQLYSPSVQRATYAATYDITTGDSYASMLYDVLLNQGKVYNDFIIYRSGDYQYVLIYGSISDDLSFDDCSIVTLNYSGYSQSGKRYNLTYTTGSGSFDSAGYNFISNIRTDNALLFHNYYERRELHAARIALYILAVLNVFNIFKFFRGGLKTI